MNAPLQVTSLNPVSDNADQRQAIALEIARNVYGGVTPESPQWQTCLNTADALLDPYSNMLKLVQNRDAKPAMDRCKDFNRQCPIGTQGVMKRADGATVITEVQKEAMVFPDQSAGETVMAWFQTLGWAPVDGFTAGITQSSAAQELTLFGQQAKNQGRNDLAEHLYVAAIKSDPQYWRAMNEYAVLLQAAARYDEALDQWNRAIEINPRSGEILNNRGMLFRSMGRAQDAVADCEEALRWLPGNELIMLNAAGALEEVDRYDECMKIVRAYNDRHPDNAHSRYNLALILLAHEEYEEGWKAYDWRLAQPSANSHYEHYHIPRWQGEPVMGERVLIWPEQGLGDEIMTASMVGDLISAGAIVTYLVSNRLVSLFRRSFPGAVVEQRTGASVMHCFQKTPLPPELLPGAVRYKSFDYQVSQGDLGRHFRSKIESFPAFNVFLESNAEMTAAIREKLRQEYGGKLLVGLSWNSSKNIRIGDLKSLSLKQMAPILSVENVTFVSLQYGDCSAEIAEIEKELGVTIVQIPGFDPLGDLDVFAAVVAAMDRVISCSNTTVHVAGGLGVQTWMLTPHGPGRLWYWGCDREESLWYPCVTLFRQKAANQWAEPVAAAAKRLKELAA